MSMTSTTTTRHDPCGQCGAPLDERQRYCVECGTSRRHPGDPVARHFTLAARRSTEPPEIVAPPRGRSDLRLTALVLALLPVAAALGVLVGKHNSGPGSDKALLAALRAQPAAATAGSATPTSAAAVTSDFSLGTGYVVQLRKLAAGTSAADVAKAKTEARAKGAAGVGIIDPKDFKLKPSSGGAYVLYSGEFKTRAAAARALSKLRKHFPKAVVLSVGSTIGGHDKAAKIAAEDAVIRKHPTAKQKSDGAKVVQQIQSKRGKSYVQQQQKLPDTIVIP
jgi:hypothetical protein